MAISPLKIQKHYEILDILFSQLPYLFWKDTDGVYQGANLNQAKNLGFRSPADFIGKTIFEILHDKKTAELISKNDSLIMQNGTTVIIEERMQLDNEERIYLSKKSPIYDEKQVIGMLGFAVDITELKREQEMALKENTRLKANIIHEKLTALRLMAASVAHEIRTPMATVNAQSGVLQQLLPTLLEGYHYALAAGKITKPLDDIYLQALAELPDDMNKTAASANTFIDMLLAKVSLEDVPSNSRPLVRLSAATEIRNAVGRYPLNDITAPLVQYDETESFEFMGDETFFRHIIFNLLKNGIFYVRAKPGGGKIHIWCEQQAHHNVIHFKDTGMGISPENLPLIFNSFYTKTHHGTGIGLAFCKMIMESFGGTIRCESVAKEYTHFILSFPKI